MTHGGNRVKGDSSSQGGNGPQGGNSSKGGNVKDNAKNKAISYRILQHIILHLF